MASLPAGRPGDKAEAASAVRFALPGGSLGFPAQCLV